MSPPPTSAPQALWPHLMLKGTGRKYFGEIIDIRFPKCLQYTKLLGGMAAVFSLMYTNIVECSEKAAVRGGGFGEARGV